jgi:hypothetical protein
MHEIAFPAQQQLRNFIPEAGIYSGTGGNAAIPKGKQTFEITAQELSVPMNN